MNADSQNDALIEQAINGEPAAIDSLMERHMPTLLAYMRSRMGELLARKESAADLAQSVCREALGELQHLEDRGQVAFQGWLFALARSKIRDRYRYYRAEKRDAARERSSPQSGFDLGMLLPSTTSPSQNAIRGEELAKLEAAFTRLPEDYREVLTWSRVLGLSHAEIAEEMGRSEGAVRVLLHRALVRLGYLLST